MTLDRTTLILHHYESSPYAEKVRFVLGAKSLPWASVDQPVIMPKPELTLLTGGYRRIPVLQVGADIYFDSRLILAEIERRHPDPPMASGIAEIMQFWSDRHMFMQTVLIVFASNAAHIPQVLIDDRNAMNGGGGFDPSKMAAALPHAISQVRASLAAVSRALGDNVWLGGDRPSFADAHAWYLLWFVKRNCPEVFKSLIAGKPELIRWTEACAALGHGRGVEYTREEAIEAARNDLPDPIMVQDGLPGEPPVGSRVALTADDYAKDPVIGTLVRASDDEFVVRRLVDGVGNIDVHAPRAGFMISAAD
jgi:glutathione S-transferase